MQNYPKSEVDCGQRYQVEAMFDGKKMVIGWCDSNPQRLVDIALAHPSVTTAWAVDRKEILVDTGLNGANKKADISRAQYARLTALLFGAWVINDWLPDDEQRQLVKARLEEAWTLAAADALDIHMKAWKELLVDQKTAATLCEQLTEALLQPVPVGTIRGTDRIKPNEPCACGSGKKAKKCCSKVVR